MNIQIIGTKSCKETQKAIRFFKERRIQFHFKDLNESSVSKGELNNIKQAIPIEQLIDTEGKEYSKRNLKFMVFNIEDELLGKPLLFKTPIVRNGKLVSVGYQPEVWKSWIS